ncbi:ATP synthase subunit b, mitochondrial [Nomia melanderi]|uniref:ATP synthase subunit b, mitochondrial n=1 Tax=Nomia melanderi TaxID=2448451 RepID=UPI00130417FE|nr:ATP synthase subunit b, mitochondrial [Nomia melanderi]
MLSRLAFRNAQLVSVAVRGITTSAPALSDIPRQKRPINPSPVKYGFIPEEWFTFFYPKTGVSGPYIFAGALGTYLLSKEWYVLEHEFYNALSLITICVYAVKKFGPTVANMLDKEIDKVEETANAGRLEEIAEYEDTIKHYELQKLQAEGQKMIFDIKKENIFMQLEAVYRERMMQVYSEVKKRLDFNAQIDSVERRLAQKHMVQWIINGVLKSITPEQEKANLQQCIKDLQALAVRS